MRAETVRDGLWGRTAWVDARAGVAGDMLLAALLDAGADLDVVRRDVAAVVGGAVTLETQTVTRGAMRATALQVRLVESDLPHRPWREVRRLLHAADLPERVRHHALEAFGALAAAEARVHGVDVEEVHFHEVGAWDSIADIVGVCAALEDLGVGMLFTSEISVGNGYVRAAHGPMPVPVPAVLELLTTHGDVVRAVPLHGPGMQADVGELATPTGVALLVALADGGGPGGMPTDHVGAVGVGAGRRDDLPWPNVVRVVLGVAGETSRPPGQPSTWDDVLQERHLEELSANVDDLDPRAWPGVIEALLGAGARDAWLTPIHMKKGRPAVTVTALAEHDTAAAVRRILFETTTTFGVRSQHVRRTELDRTHVPVEVTVAGHTATVAIKLGTAAGQIVRATPEYEEVAAVARACGRPLVEVLAAASAAAHAAGLHPGAPAPAASTDPATPVPKLGNASP